MDFDPRHLPDSYYRDPFPVYAELRREAPVYRCPDGSYFLTRYEDLNAVYRNPRVFMGTELRAPEYERVVTSARAVGEMVRIAKTTSP